MIGWRFKTLFSMCWQNTSRTPQTDSKSSSRQDPFQATPPDSFELEPNTKAIGIGGRSGKWKDGCVRPASSTSKALPKRFSCRHPPKACETRRWVQNNMPLSRTASALQAVRENIVPGRSSRKGSSQPPPSGELEADCTDWCRRVVPPLIRHGGPGGVRCYSRANRALQPRPA